MSEVSRFITRPSLEGTLADSLISWVRMDSLVVGLERIDQMNALRQHLSRHPPEQGEHADVPGIHPGHGGEDQDHQHERGRRDPEQPQDGVGIGVNHVAAGLIEYRHRIPSPPIVCQLINAPSDHVWRGRIEAGRDARPPQDQNPR